MWTEFNGLKKKPTVGPGENTAGSVNGMNLIT
jgi:hypothetical protein